MSFKIRHVYFTAAISAMLTVAAVASAKYKADNALIKVSAHGPGGLAIDGKSSTLKISEDDKSVVFKTFLNTIDTGIGQRNEHMQDRFEAAKFPEITLTVSKDKADPKKGGTAPGLLKFHGVEKPVTVHYTVNGKSIVAKFDFVVTDHGIKDDALCRFGVCAKPDVKIEVDFDLKE